MTYTRRGAGHEVPRRDVARVERTQSWLHVPDTLQGAGLIATKPEQLYLGGYA